MRQTTWRTLLLAAATWAATVQAADFLPLQDGNRWVYREATTGQTLEVRVGTPVMTNGKVYYSLTGFSPTRQLVRVNEAGNLVYWDEELEAEPLLTGFRYTGTPFSASGRECPAWATVEEKRAPYAGAAGYWQALRVSYQPYACADAGVLDEQFAENIGMVRRVENSIAGPRTFDLVYARVGRAVIDAATRGGFSISATDDVRSGAWNVTLRVEPSLSGSLPVTFPSGQEYDLRLRDVRGNILWTWSADKLFPQVIRSVPDIGGWSATVSVPHPPRVPEAAHTFILEAWLTNLESEPRFAAAVPLTLYFFEVTASGADARRR